MVIVLHDLNLSSMKYDEIKNYVNKFQSNYTVDEHKELFMELVNLLNSDNRKNVQKLGEKLKKHINAYHEEIIRVKHMYDFDKSFGDYKYIAGVDEVGRGPLAGPIVSAAVILDLDFEKDKDMILYINDSKKISQKLREELAEKIKENALSYNISVINNEEIDEKGIGWCNNEVFKKACDGLSITPEVVLSDGYLIKDFNIKNYHVIKGDTKSASIACASILAKVFRDKLMEDYSREFLNYGFERNVGYGTEEHVKALKTYGAVKIHRKSFLKNIL